jgi:hypothetical protein
VLDVTADQRDMIQVWYVLYPLALAVVCVLNAVFPRKMWGLFKSWKYKNPETVEPSDLVVAWYRFTGIVGAIALTGFAIWFFLDARREAICDDVMSELSQRYIDGGSDALEQRAGELGVDVEGLTGTSRVAPYDYEIRQDGETIGYLRPQTGGWTCDPPLGQDT